MARRQGLGRGLEAFEVALIKNMRGRKMPRDYIMSFIVRPGRTTSPAAVDDVKRGRIGGEIEAAAIQVRGIEPEAYSLGPAISGRSGKSVTIALPSESATTE